MAGSGEARSEEDASKEKTRAIAIEAKPSESTRQRQRSRSRERGERERLKPPPKTSVKTSVSSTPAATKIPAQSAPGKTASEAGSTASKAPTKPLADDVLTRVAQEKWEAQEDRLRDLAKASMTFIREYGKMSPQTCHKKVVELTKTAWKYNQQFIRINELQEKTRKRECDVLDKEIERLKEETEMEIENAKALKLVVEREKARGQRHLDMDKTAAEINQFPTRAELQEQIAKEEAEIEKNRQMFQEIKALNAQKDQKVQMLLHVVNDLRRDIQTLNEKEATFGGPLGAEAPSSSSTAVQVIS